MELTEGALPDMSLLLSSLQQENESLKRKIVHLQSVIQMKDTTINDLNKKLQLHTQLLANEPKGVYSRATTPIKDASLEIPQRNSNRSSMKNHSMSNSTASITLANSDTTALSEQKRVFSNHMQKDSITSITSSHYSDSEPPETPRQTMNYPNESTNALALELDLKQGDLTLGSSPRKLSPNRKAIPVNEMFPLENKTFDGTENVTIEDTNNTINNDAQIQEKFNDFHFGNVETPSEPVYKMSHNSSPIVDYFNQKSQETHANEKDIDYNGNSGNSIINEVDTVDVNAELDDNSLLNLKSHSRTGSRTHSRSHSRNVSNPKILALSTALQNKKDESGSTTPDSIYSDHVQTPPALPEHPPIPPPHPPHPQHATRSNIPPQIPQMQPLLQPSHKRIVSTDDSEKFLLNSLDHSIIRIESLIHPQSLAFPIDANNANHPLAKTKRNTYKVSFMVYTDENPAMLTPIYRVKRSYDDLLLMDKKIRPLVPSLPQLPDFTYIASLNYKYWANSKKVIQSYINKLLLLLKNRDTLNQNNLIWKNFSNYFEFKMDPDNLDDPEYSVLNLQDKLTYLLYIKKNFTAKTFDFIKLNYTNESNELTVNFLLAKSHETLHKDEINVSYKSQEITLKKKKKFSSSKTWVMYAESEYDASEVCNGLKNWIGSSLDSFDDDDQGSVITDSNKDDDSESHSRISLIDNNNVNASPIIPAPWKIFKKSSSKQSHLLTSPVPSSTTTMNSISMPSSPVKLASGSPAPSNDSVLNFKAMPYESAMLTPDLSIPHGLRSPMKLSHTIGKPDLSFKPIDGSSYFNSTLKHSYELCPDYKLNGMGVPSIVYQCITFLHQQSGEGFEGIFRLNGMMSEVNKIQGIFNENNDCQLSKLTPIPDVHSIATLLKRYLRNLNDSLIPIDATSEIGRVINTFGVNKSCLLENDQLSPSTILNKEGILEFSKIFNEQVPELNKNTLHVLFRYLKDVLKMGQHNKMTTSAMSVLMGPNVTQGDGGGQICIVLLENFNDVFK